MYDISRNARLLILEGMLSMEESSTGTASAPVDEPQPLRLKFLEPPLPSKSYYGDPPSGSPPFTCDNPLFSVILESEQLHSEKSTRYVFPVSSIYSYRSSCKRISFRSADLLYRPGDYVGVYPSNASALVQFVAKKLSLNLNSSFTIDESNREGSFTF